MSTAEQKTDISYTVETLAGKLHLKKDTLYKWIKRRNYSGEGELSTRLLGMIAEYYYQKGKTKETQGAAGDLLAELGVKSIAPKPRAKRQKRVISHSSNAKGGFSLKEEFRGRPLAFIFLVSASVVAMFHTAKWSIEIAAFEGYPLAANVIYGIFSAGAIQFTAFTMTVYRGGRGYLIAFALLDFFIILMSLAPWTIGHPGQAPDIWAGHILYSAAVSFSIFSYFGLFTDKAWTVHGQN